VLLFDEPLSNLDAKLREQMRVEIRELQQRVVITSVYVTHDQVEAMSISDEIVIMNAGAVEQRGKPQVIYARPASRFVADFIGKANFVEATILDAATVDVAGNRVTIVDMPATPAGARVTLVIRPEAVRLSRESGALKGTVRRAMFLGNVAEYLVTVDGVGDWLVDSPNPAEAGMFGVEGPIYLNLSPSSVHVLPS
jgi:iron(III) transport system ATP-binding protein